MEIFDSTVIEKLMLISQTLQKDVLADVMRIFIRDAPSTLLKMEANFQEQNFKNLSSLAHKLKGSSINIGAPLGFVNLCEKIENIDVSNENQEIESLLHQLKIELKEVMEYITINYLNKDA